MKFRNFISKRYLTHTRRSGFLSFISLFSILGITLGTAALIITLSILAGFEKEIKEKVFSFMTHIQIEGFQNQPLTDYDNTINIIRSNVLGVKKISPYVAKEAMVKAGENVDGIFLKGIDVVNDASNVKRYLKFGNYLSDDSNTREILVGNKLAVKLGIELGDSIIVYGLPVDQKYFQPKFAVMKVVGIFESGMAEYDDIFAYTSLNQAQKIFGYQNSVSAFDVVIDSVENVNLIANRMREILKYPHYVRTTSALYHNLFAWIELQKKPAPIFLGLITIVAVVNIIGTLLMMVLERIRDIGILKSLGASAKDIKAIFITQSFILAMIGITFGNLIAWILCQAQLKWRFFSLPSDIYYMSSVPIILEFENFLLVNLLVLSLCILSSFIPAKAAARLDAVQIMRFEV